MEFKGQHEDEEVLFLARSYPLELRKPVYGLMLIAPLLFIQNQYLMDVEWAKAASSFIMYFGILALLVYLVFKFISWKYSHLILTDQRLLQYEQKGLFSRKVSQIDLENIQNVNIEQKGISASLMKYGDVEIEKISGSVMMAKNIRNPDVFQDEILKTIKRIV